MRAVRRRLARTRHTLMAQQVIGDRYEIHSRLGRGGMASVYRAMDTRLMREVAIKVMQLADTSIDSGYFFHREARAIAALRHYNIVQVYDYSGPKESPVFLVMELVDGGTLEAVMDDRRVLPDPVTVSVAMALAAALEHAHDRGVVHRDLKPGNVMVEKTGRVLLADFGIAKPYRDTTDFGMTLAGKETALVGTPAFMAPEQVLEEEIGPAADVFSLGSLVYCMLTGTSPFAGPDMVEMLRRIIDIELQPLDQRRPETAAPIVDLVHACLQRDARRRPTATEAKHACDEILRAKHVDNPERCIVESLELDRTAITGRSRRVSVAALRRDGPAARRGSADAATLAPSADEPSAREGPVRGAEPTARPAPSPLEGTTRWLRQENASVRVWAQLFGRPPRVVRGAWLAGGTLGLGALVVLVVALAAGRERTVSRVEPIARAATPAIPSGPAETPAAPPPAPSPAFGTRATTPPARPQSATARVRLPPSRPTAPGPTPGGAAASEPARVRPAPAKRSAGRQHRGRSTADATARRPAVVALKVIPWGTVLVDGVEKGNAPVMRTVALSPGRHTITVRHPGFGEMHETINVRAGEQRTLRFDLGSRR